MATLYFGYGSNLWKEQMQKRCPTSQYLGIARLSGFKWIINSRGYANVVELAAEENEQLSGDHASESWGLVYSLQPEDERRLDINEGVPAAYTKEYLSVDFWPVASCGERSAILDIVSRDKPPRKEMLVYIDRLRTKPDQPKKEYVFRMNKGIADALQEGVPAGYVDDVLRRFIPEVEDEAIEKLARKQAMSFEDEE